MDNSKEYIAMCTKAKDIRTYKYKIGFNEGDYVFNGFYVRIVGHDFINFDEASKEGNYNIFRFAVMKKPEGPLTTVPGTPNTLDLIHGEYVTEWIETPIWIPTQGQLQRLHIDLSTIQEELSRKYWMAHLIQNFYIFAVGEQFGSFENKVASIAYSLKFKSMEQLWLAFIMQEEYGKQWKGKEWVEI